MSYSNQTVHYGIPLPQQTDLVNGLDWNTSSEAIDGALYDATQIATTVKADMEEVKTDIVDLKAEDVKIETSATELTARVSTIEQNMQTDEQDIQDAFDMITDKEVTQAQADVHVDEKEWFRYNGVLYVATKEINIGDTIVPNENCRATNIEDEMPSGGTEGYAEQMICDTEVVGDTAADTMAKNTWFRMGYDLCKTLTDISAGTKLVEGSNYEIITVEKLNSEIGDLTTLETVSNSNLVSAINEAYTMSRVRKRVTIASGTASSVFNSVFAAMQEATDDEIPFAFLYTTSGEKLQLITYSSSLIKFANCKGFSGNPNVNTAECKATGSTWYAWDIRSSGLTYVDNSSYTLGVDIYY